MQTALVLSGGGAKGSFELGAIQFLYKYNFAPQIICGTSVGSINALKLAEGEGTSTQGLPGLEQLWFNLSKNTDMYDEEGWVQGLAEWIKDMIRDNTPRMPSDWFTQLFTFGLTPGYAADYLDDLQKFKDGLESHNSLFHLEPIRLLAEAKISADLVASSGIKLRMAVVALESGRLMYVSEFGRLLDDPGKASDDSNSPDVGLIPGMLASAAIPAIFRAQKLTNDVFVDGGTREIVPVSAAVTMGANIIYTIVAPTVLAPKVGILGILKIADRALDIAEDEIVIGDLRCNERPGVAILEIRPAIEIESSRTIDRGLIRINAAYGYMKAFDTLGQVSHSLRHQLHWLADSIAEFRHEAWKLENETTTAVERWMLGPTKQLLDAAQNEIRDKFARLRELKNTVRRYMDCRVTCVGPESLGPSGYEQGWFLDWEAHDPDWHTLGISPWASVAWPIGQQVDDLDAQQQHKPARVAPPMEPVNPAPKGFIAELLDDYFSVDAATSEVTPFAACQLGNKSSPPSGVYVEAGLNNENLALIRHGVVERYVRDDKNRQWSLSEAMWAPLGPAAGLEGIEKRDVKSVSLLPSAGEGLFALVQLEPRTINGSKGSYLVLYKLDVWDWRQLEVVSVRGATGRLERLNGVSCAPAIIEGSWGLSPNSNYEMICCQAGKLKHYARLNDGAKDWIYVQDVPLPATSRSSPSSTIVFYTPVAINMIQSSFTEKLFPTGNLEVFVVFEHESTTGSDNYLAEYSFDARSRRWNGPTRVVLTNNNMPGLPHKPIVDVQGRPAVVQDFLTGDFEMLLVQDGKVNHYSKLNSQAGSPWIFRSTVYHASRGIGLGAADSVAMFQSLASKDLQAVVHCATSTGIQATHSHNAVTGLIHFTYSRQNQAWNGPDDVSTAQNPLSDVLPF